MIAVYKKELKSYFTSVIGFVFMAFFLAIVGIYFLIYNLLNAYSNFEYVLQTISFLFVILIPIITMKIIAEENRQKTDQLLLTALISIEQMVLGKYLAVLTLFFITMAVTLVYPIILQQFGTVDLLLAYSGIKVLFLFFCFYL